MFILTVHAAVSLRLLLGKKEKKKKWGRKKRGWGEGKKR